MLTTQKPETRSWQKISIFHFTVVSLFSVIPAQAQKYKYNCNFVMRMDVVHFLKPVLDSKERKERKGKRKSVVYMERDCKENAYIWI